MTAASMKDKALEAIEQLPSDATVDQMMEQLYFLSKVQRGLQQIDAGQVVSHEEAKRRFGR
jgi:predicted transcriptional regulator